jgi:nucleotide-binding universal stress UspA family protein
MFDTILVPTDGSDYARRAAEHGAALARASDAALHVITVVDLQVAGGPFSAGGLPEEDRDRRRQEGHRTVDRIEEGLDVPDLRTTVLDGAPVESVLEYAKNHEVDLLAMGTQGRTGLDRYVTGSVTESVLRRAEVPVLTVRGTDWSQGVDGYEDVLVTTDGSDSAAAAVDPALAVAERFGARVHALTVVNVGDIATSPDYQVPRGILDDLRAGGEAAVEAIATRAREAGLEAVTRAEEGLPGGAILEYTADAHVDLLAMGTAGRTGLNRFLLGSTTERVIRHAEAPVLAVNTRDQPGD